MFAGSPDVDVCGIGVTGGSGSVNEDLLVLPGVVVHTSGAA